MKMEKRFEHKLVEQKIADMWEKGGYFKPSVDPAKTPYTIVLPPPNASGKMHTGNVLMIAIEDLLIRWKRMKGFSALWVPGTDHAGFETQITFEKELYKQGKSRLDFDRETLYSMVWDFVQKNKGLIESQIKGMGASVDWSRYTFTLDSSVVDTVCNTFKKMHEDNLIYRGDYIVNYCPKCGTTFADLEIDFVERKDALYYINYPLVGEDEFVTVATVRPETIFVDMWLAVNPKDKKKKDLVGKKVLNPLTGEEIEIIADSFVDPKFGTGVVKVTPAHDKNDFEVGLRFGLHGGNQIKTAIDWNGRMSELAVIRPKNGDSVSLAGMSVKQAREKTVEFLNESGTMSKIDDKYEHAVSVCYKGNHDIEPMIVPNWFVRVKDLKDPALQVVKDGVVKIYPKWREKTYINWMEEMRDWPISRQVVWGIRIPVWYNVKGNEEFLYVTWLDESGVSHTGSLQDTLAQGFKVSQIEKGLQKLIALPAARYEVSKEKPKGGEFLPETDTFDTWFSSGQWPLVTLKYPDSEDFKYFYPTNVLETGWEIIRFWVARMIMFGMYLTKDVKHPANYKGKGIPPFNTVYLHGMVRALDGRKMSKSLGNIINPDEYQAEYGTDALRMGLIAGTANGKDFAFPRDKVIGYRNYANKLWNMARFVLMLTEQYETESGQRVVTYSPESKVKITDADKVLIKNFNAVAKNVDKFIEKYRFSDAAEAIYRFTWHEMADIYIEQAKQRVDKDIALGVFRYVYGESLKLLHPFMPFVTEAIWQELKSENDRDLADCAWPVK